MRVNLMFTSTYIDKLKVLYIRIYVGKFGKAMQLKGVLLHKLSSVVLKIFSVFQIFFYGVSLLGLPFFRHIQSRGVHP